MVSGSLKGSSESLVTRDGVDEMRQRSVLQEALRNDRLILVGKNSYIGAYLAHYASILGAPVLSLSSRDCDFLNWDHVSTFFRSLDHQSSTVVFLAVVNKPTANSFQAYLQNVQMVKHLIEGHKLSHVSHIFYFSSIDVYGTQPPLPITEQSPINPMGWYGLAKYTCEWLLRSSGDVDCPVTILRLPGVYGRAPHDRSVIGKIVSDLHTSKRVTIHGSGTILRDYVSLEDLCRLVEVLLPLRYNGVLNVGTGHSHRLIDIVKLVGQILRTEFEIVYDATDPEREFDVVFDTRRLASLVPAFSFQDLAHGIQTYLESMTP